MKSLLFKTVALSLAATWAGIAMAKSGEVSIIQCSGGEVQNVVNSPQHSFGTGKTYGTVRTDPAGGLFDMMTTQCMGAYVVVDGKPSAWGHCEWLDKDGDKVLLHYARSEGLAGKFNVVHGTGKYAGLSGTRDYKIIPFPAVPGIRTVCDEGKLQYTMPD